MAGSDCSVRFNLWLAVIVRCHTTKASSLYRKLYILTKFIILISAIVLTSCAAYKVVPEGKLTPVAVNKGELTVTKTNKWSGGAHCYEPMLYVLTLGIIPTHCVDSYSVSSELEVLGKFKVTSMNGWAALFIAPFPTWQYGSGAAVETELKDLVQRLD